MPAELVAFKVSATALAVKVSELVTFYREKRVVDRTRLDQIKLQADEALRIARSRGAGELARVNIEEIAKTQHLIDYFNLNGEALRHAMTQLEQLSTELTLNLKGFGNA